jgi:hypothetical protein
MRTFEEICLEKLKELGTATAREWAFAMGYENPNALSKVIRRILQTMPNRMLVHNGRKPRLYEAIY